MIDIPARLLAGVAVAAALLFGAACGSGGSSTGNQGNSGTFTGFQDCLQKHGVTVPGRSPGNGSPSARPSSRPSGRPSFSDKQRQALQACASLRPSAPPNGGGQ